MTGTDPRATGEGTASVYLSPHPDDWLLFCGHSACTDLLRPGHRTVFVYTTAGDAGRGDAWWRSRERAVIAAAATTLGDAPVKRFCVGVGNRKIACARVGSSRHYFMRLPDGLPDGKGSHRRGGTSLSHLREDGRPISAVDGSAVYTNWTAFVETLAEIIAHSTAQTAVPPIHHAPDHDAETNPGDHADHVASSQALLEIAQAEELDCRWWLTYCSLYHHPNIEGPDLERKRYAFEAYVSTLSRGSHSGGPWSDTDAEWLAWGDRGMFRDSSFCSSQVAHNTKLEWPDRIASGTMFRACPTVIRSADDGGIRLRHVLTGAEVVLSPTAGVLWDLLQCPHSALDLGLVLASARCAPDPMAGIEQANAFLEPLLKARLIVAETGTRCDLTSDPVAPETLRPHRASTPKRPADSCA